MGETVKLLRADAAGHMSRLFRARSLSFPLFMGSYELMTGATFGDLSSELMSDDGSVPPSTTAALFKVSGARREGTMIATSRSTARAFASRSRLSGGALLFVKARSDEEHTFRCSARSRSDDIVPKYAPTR
jgi:hypothetical protein